MVIIGVHVVFLGLVEIAHIVESAHAWNVRVDYRLVSLVYIVIVGADWSVELPVFRIFDNIQILLFIWLDIRLINDIID